jgi:hypothetical protein
MSFVTLLVVAVAVVAPTVRGVAVNNVSISAARKEYGTRHTVAILTASSYQPICTVEVASDDWRYMHAAATPNT